MIYMKLRFETTLDSYAYIKTKFNRVFCNNINNIQFVFCHSFADRLLRRPSSQRLCGSRQEAINIADSTVRERVSAIQKNGRERGHSRISSRVGEFLQNDIGGRAPSELAAHVETGGRCQRGDRLFHSCPPFQHRICQSWRG